MDNTIVVARFSNNIPEFSTITGVTVRRHDTLAHIGHLRTDTKDLRMVKKPRTEQTYGTYMKKFQD
jgi:hypothetical protein